MQTSQSFPSDSAVISWIKQLMVQPWSTSQETDSESIVQGQATEGMKEDSRWGVEEFKWMVRFYCQFRQFLSKSIKVALRGDIQDDFPAPKPDVQSTFPHYQTISLGMHNEALRETWELQGAGP